MIYSTTLLALALAGMTSGAAAWEKAFPADVATQKERWTAFKTRFNLKFDTVEEDNRRLSVFLANLQEADALTAKDHAAGGSAIFGETQFSHLTKAEFRSQYLTVDTKAFATVESDLEKWTMPVGATPQPVLVDWTGVLTTPIKNQGQCGCCWAFSSAEQVESDSMRMNVGSWTLSPEQFCQCVTVCSGCNGGNTSPALNYAKTHAIEQNSDYPYTSYYGVTGSCSYSQAKGVVYVSTVTQIVSGGGNGIEDNMAVYLQNTNKVNNVYQGGPISILVDAEVWSSYKSGIMSAATCGTTIDHAVQAVGVYPVSASSGGYWKVRNQWGTSWGESGYIQLAYGTNTCNLTYQPLWTTVTKA